MAQRTDREVENPRQFYYPDPDTLRLCLFAKSNRYAKKNIHQGFSHDRICCQRLWFCTFRW